MTDQKTLHINGIPVGNDQPFVLFGGMNVLESRDLAMQVAEEYATVTQRLGIPWVFKASFDKANRSSLTSYRGPGLDEGLKIFEEVKKTFGCALLTDVHEPYQAAPAAEVIDVLQLPAFLARQTDLVVAMAKTGRVINIKKPQFLAPREMGHILHKCEEAGNDQLILCERGSSFGYNNLVVDMLSIPEMKKLGCPVTIDATHAVQLPGADPRTAGASTGGRRDGVSIIAKSAVAAGADGVFLEFHTDPDKALCDGPSCLPLSAASELLTTLKRIHQAING